MVFTPLLASTCVGTLECRAVALSLTDIQPRLKEAWVSRLLQEAIRSLECLLYILLRGIRNPTENNACSKVIQGIRTTCVTIIQLWGA